MIVLMCFCQLNTHLWRFSDPERPWKYEMGRCVLGDKIWTGYLEWRILNQLWILVLMNKKQAFVLHLILVLTSPSQTAAKNTKETVQWGSHRDWWWLKKLWTKYKAQTRIFKRQPRVMLLHQKSKASVLNLTFVWHSFVSSRVLFILRFKDMKPQVTIWNAYVPVMEHHFTMTHLSVLLNKTNQVILFQIKSTLTKVKCLSIYFYL